jgi:hypothetical protein
MGHYIRNIHKMGKLYIYLLMWQHLRYHSIALLFCVKMLWLITVRYKFLFAGIFNRDKNTTPSKTSFKVPLVTSKSTLEFCLQHFICNYLDCWSTYIQRRLLRSALPHVFGLPICGQFNSGRGYDKICHNGHMECIL